MSKSAQIFSLFFEHARYFEIAVILKRRVGQSEFAVERWLDGIRAKNVLHREGVSCWLDAAGIDFVEVVDVGKNFVELSEDAFRFVWADFEPRKTCDGLNVGFGNFHKKNWRDGRKSRAVHILSRNILFDEIIEIGLRHERNQSHNRQNLFESDAG